MAAPMPGGGVDFTGQSGALFYSPTSSSGILASVVSGRTLV